MRSDARGAIFVETLIAFFPVVVFFLAVWQVADACAAHLIVKRAESAAARAAVVVLPDDGRFYGADANTGVNSLGGVRQDDIDSAARLVLAASPHFTSTSSQVELSPGKFQGKALVTAKVTADYRCLARWVSFVCGASGTIPMTAEASLPYQGASYQY